MTAFLEMVDTSISEISTAIPVKGIFPNAFLEANGFEKKGYYWGNDNLLFYTLQCDSNFEIHVVDNTEVWVERFGHLSLLKQVKTGADLLDLERLLG